MKIVYASLLVVALIGCWADKKIDIDNIQPVALSEEKVKLVQSDTLIFELDSLTSPKSWMHQFKVIKEVPYFFIANTAINAIQAYNFNLKKVEKIIPFKTVGSNSIRLRENFYVHNWDSLFLFTNAPNKVFLFDSSAILRQSWSIMLREEHKDFTITTQEYYFKPYFETRNSSVGFWMYPPTSPYSKDYFRNAKAVEYNLSKAT